MKPFLLILSAPSGGGKTTIARALTSAREDIGYSISATTRRPRDSETDGKDYHFLDRADFEERANKGEFLEWAEYGGNLYGTLEESVDNILSEGRHVVLDIDVQGASAIKARRGDVVSIFIIPPSADVLMERLGGRGSESQAELVARLETAVEELREAGAYDYIVVNTDRTQAVAEVAAIVEAETRKPGRNPTLMSTLEGLGTDIAEVARKLASE